MGLWYFGIFWGSKSVLMWFLSTASSGGWLRSAQLYCQTQPVPSGPVTAENFTKQVTSVSWNITVRTSSGWLGLRFTCICLSQNLPTCSLQSQLLFIYVLKISYPRDCNVNCENCSQSVTKQHLPKLWAAWGGVSTDIPGEHQVVLSPLPHSLQKRIVKQGRGTPHMHLKIFPSKWPKQMPFHFKARSGTSRRSPSFPSTSWPSSQEGRATWQAHVGLPRTGNQGSPTGTPPCTSAALPCSCPSLWGGVHIAGRMPRCFSAYPPPPDSLQLFGCVSEGAQACWAVLISSGSHLHTAQKQHFCVNPL